ncbi:hypothetical protein WA026_020253 [Henosepilachna vigintioctopunctata]|uniref:Uncharacterized protein n=1 Tax=Henosepilachna vigintioctopunctata TaxID=420089 RepID=A0AAW1TYG0_9CUCU
MDWLWKFLVTYIGHVCFTTVFITPAYASLYEFSDGDVHIQDVGDSAEDQNIDNSIKMLVSILRQPWPPGMSPVVYLEDNVEDLWTDQNQNPRVIPESFEQVDRNIQDKRSKYYRKYPLKRQNRYSRYDAENRYMCLPSKNDVYRLLIALHETKQGIREKTVNFCNRRRPAKTVFTNIRFLGK